MRNSEKNWSPDLSTKWSQSTAQLRPWFLGSGTKGSRLDEGPSSSNRTVNSRCSEIELEHNGTLAAISSGERSTKEKEPMELLPVELRKTLPPLYSQESCPTPIVHVKLFTPDSSFTWYVTEGAEQEDGDWLLFGLVIGFEEEWGYSLLSEIASARGPLGLPVERDLWFKPGPIDQVLRRGRPSAAVKEGDV
jgi:hypothetical protein